MTLEIFEVDGVLHLWSRGGWRGFRAVEPHAGRGTAAALAGAAGDAVRAPVPGVVASVAVVPGSEVAPGDPLVVLESMKMFQTLAAPAQARIAAVHCAAGDAVTPGQALISLEPVSGTAPGAGSPQGSGMNGRRP